MIACGKHYRLGQRCRSRLLVDSGQAEPHLMTVTAVKRAVR
jgi:hypothetical protein